MAEKKKNTHKFRYYIATYENNQEVSIVEFDARNMTEAKRKLKKLVPKDKYNLYTLKEKK